MVSDRNHTVIKLAHDRGVPHALFCMPAPLPGTNTHAHYCVQPRNRKWSLAWPVHSLLSGQVQIQKYVWEQRTDSCQDPIFCSQQLWMVLPVCHLGSGHQEQDGLSGSLFLHYKREITCNFSTEAEAGGSLVQPQQRQLSEEASLCLKTTTKKRGQGYNSTRRPCVQYPALRINKNGNKITASLLYL